MSHKLLYLAIFTLFVVSVATTVMEGNADGTTRTEGNTDTTTAKGNTDTTTTAEGNTDTTTTAEGNTDTTTTTKGNTDTTTTAEGNTDATTTTKGDTDTTTTTKGDTDTTTTTKGNTDTTTTTKGDTDTTTTTKSDTDATTTAEGNTDTTTTTKGETDATTTAEGNIDATTTTEGSTDETSTQEISTTDPTPNPEVRVFFINDLHYHILPLDDKFQPCASDPCFGGLARLKKTLNDLNEINPLIISSGHSFDGELFNAFGFSAFKHVTTNLGFSAQVPSEELYSFGLEAADSYISSEDANMVCANLNPKKSLELTASDDCKISVIGFVEKTRIDELHLDNFTAEEEISAVEAEVKKAKGNIIIVVGSSSLEKAREIAKIEKVNVVLVSGAKIDSDKDVWEDTGDGSYVGSLNVKDTSLDSIFKVGELTFTVEEGCKLKSVEMKPLPYKDAKEDDDVKVSMAPYLERLSVATKTDATLNCSVVCQTSECAVGSLVADAIVMHLASDSKMPRLALVPGNVFSDLIVKDEVKGSDLYRMLDNFYVCTTVMKGSVLKQFLETSVADYKHSESPMENYLQISGFFRVVYDMENDKGKRVDQLQIFSSDSGEWKFEDISDDKDYSVVIPANLREKENAFDFLPNGTVLDETMLDALSHYLSANGNQWLVPPLGVRIQYKQGSSDNHNECYNNTGEVIILTLFVAGVLSGLGIFLWKYVYPRYRARRGSTIHLIS